MKRKTPLVVGNWKMHPTRLSDAVALAKAVKQGGQRLKGVTLVVAPPYLYLYEVNKVRANNHLALASQDAHFAESGAYTGSVSAKMLIDTGVQYVIVGHSERREAGEDDALVRQKLDAILKAKLTPIICVGERQRDRQGDFFATVEAQVQAAFAGLSKAAARKVVIAYEPIWAIGSGDNATPEDVEEMRLFLQKTLAGLFDRTTVQAINILYGGSVNTKNCDALTQETEVDGFLVGGASLRADDFIQISRAIAAR